MWRVDPELQASYAHERRGHMGVLEANSRRNLMPVPMPAYQLQDRMLVICCAFCLTVLLPGNMLRPELWLH